MNIRKAIVIGSIGLAGLLGCKVDENHIPDNNTPRTPANYDSGAAITAADFNRDGEQDLAYIVVKGSIGRVYVEMNGNIRQVATIPANYDSGAAITNTDMNNDRCPDLIIGAIKGSIFRRAIIYNDGTGNFR